jgi:lysozyme
MRKPIFDAIRAAKGSLSLSDVDVIDLALDRIGIPRETSGSRAINAAGLDIVKRSEGLRLKAYICPAGVLTVGFGSTGPHVKPGMTITAEEAEKLLRDDLRRFEDGVAKLAKVATDNQFSALVSFAFNVGLEALKTSTLLRKHNEGDHAGAKAEFAKWVRGGGKVLPGLVTRRADEAELYGRTA